MARRPKLIFLLADGARARLVHRTEADDFATFQEMDGGERLRDFRAVVRNDPAGRVIESVGGARHAVGPEDPIAPLKLAFASEAARAALNQAKARKAQGIVVVAPARLLPAIRRAAAAGPVVASLAKDLTKTPDAELERWLAPLEAETAWARVAD